MSDDDVSQSEYDTADRWARASMRSPDVTTAQGVMQYTLAKAYVAARKRIAELEAERKRFREADLPDLVEYAKAANLRGLIAVTCRISSGPCFCGAHVTDL